MEENKYEIGVQKQPQRGHVLLIHSMWFLFVPRAGYGGQEQGFPRGTETAPGRTRSYLNGVHKKLIENMWGQQRATLQSSGANR